MRYMKPVLVLAIAGALATACGSTTKPSDSGASDTGTPLPVAVTGPQSEVVARGDGDALRIMPIPPASATVQQKVEHALREDILSKVRVVATTSATCPGGITMKAGAVSQCVVTYEGAEVPYEVKISDRYKDGDRVFSYTKEPKKALLVAKVVYHQLNESYGAESGRTDASKLACEEFPAAKAMEFGADTGLTCQYWSKYGKDGEPGYVTLKVTMGKRGYGVGFEEVR